MTVHRYKKQQPLQFSRRDTLRLLGGAGAAGVLGAGLPAWASAQATPEAVTIEIPEPFVDLPTEDVTLRWLDSGDTKSFLLRPFFEAYMEARPNITIQYDPLANTQIAEVVPLAIQNGTAHDIIQLPGNIIPAQAVAEGWVQPLDDHIPNFEEWKARFPPATFLPGFTDFNGQTYGAPHSSQKEHGSLLLFNVDYMQQAGYDPSAQTLTWEEFREAARQVTEQGGGEYYGLIMGAGQTARFAAFVGALGRLAGVAAGPDDIDFLTGEYVYNSEEFLAAMELLLAIKDDGSMVPGELSRNAVQARGQMALGAAGMIVQGPWNIPTWQAENPDFNFGVASAPVPDEAESVPLQAGLGDPTWWFYSESQNGAIVADIYNYLYSIEGQRDYVELTSRLALFPEANEAADVNAQARAAIDLFDQQVRTSPDPRVRNLDVTEVYSELQELTPNFGDTLEGIYTGQLPDARAALQDLQERADAELDRAIEAARANGADVSRDDWVFSNWDPYQDYGAEDYAELE